MNKFAALEYVILIKVNIAPLKKSKYSFFEHKDESLKIANFVKTYVQRVC